MKLFYLSIVTALVVFAGNVSAEEKVSLSGLHLCCGKCVKGVNGAIDKVDGATATFDKDAGTGVVTATDKATAQKALDELAAAGFHGAVEGSSVAFVDDSGAKGKTKSLTVSEVHNCCGSCAKGLTKAVNTVEGAKIENLEKKATSFTVSGDFDAKKLVKALNDAGYHVKVN